MGPAVGRRALRILFCVEFYFPSIGGAQEVVRQLAERLATRGHQVSVATSRVATRHVRNHRGVEIVEFNVRGNRVRGMHGDIDSYRRLLVEGGFELVFFYAAQQWTFDAAWDVIDDIPARKVLVPCGYSGLFDPTYKRYFEALPDILRRMDAVIYHAKDYRDVNFARAQGLANGELVPNAAAGEEFEVEPDPHFRSRIGAREHDFVILTVGTMTGLKGHQELVQAIGHLEFEDRDRRVFLILNGNQPERGGRRPGAVLYLFNLVKEYGPIYAAKHSLRGLLARCGWHVGRTASLRDRVQQINRHPEKRKRAIMVDLPRAELIQAYLNADLFVFASNVEYSPLVLFEACAAGLPFLTVPVGNAAEIVDWTAGGELCAAETDGRGYTRVDPVALARHVAMLANDSARLRKLGQQGRDASRLRYNWETIVGEYESIFVRLVEQGRGLAEGVP